MQDPGWRVASPGILFVVLSSVFELATLLNGHFFGDF
jgi:hypothetical protein